MADTTSTADGGAYNPLEGTSAAPTDDQVQRLKSLLSPNGLVRDVRFNAPLPLSVHNGWIKYSDQWNQPSPSASPTSDVTYYNSNVGFGANQRVNGPGYILLDPQIQVALETATTSNPDGTQQPTVAVPNPSGRAWVQRKTRWGFRFHFNPPSYQETFTRRMDVNWAQYLQVLSESKYPLPDTNTGSSLSVDLLLSRRDDMRILTRPDYADFYPAGITSEQATDILNRGTMHDLEHLFRVVNGEPWETWHGTTSDWGMLFPVSVLVFLGNAKGARRIRAMLQSFSFTHRQFAPGMVPVYTEVTLNMNRMPDLYYTQTQGSEGAADPGVRASVPTDTGGGGQ